VRISIAESHRKAREQMQIVIDISGSLYSYISKEDAVYFPDDGEELFEAVKNGTLLDKIRAEIVEDIEKYNDIYDDTCHGLRMALDIIDKYKAESEKE
jgi:hypothetical protein